MDVWNDQGGIIMGNISSVAGNVAAYNSQNVNETNKNEKKSGVDKTNVSGKTIGKPKLSDEASKYYEQLKKKYSNMDFILVSKDMKEQAKSQAASYANANKMVVLIDEDKIERMASDESYRKQYEGIIANAASGLSQLGASLGTSKADVKGYGMQVNDDGTATYFAVLKKSSAAQKERIEKNAAKKKAQKKEDEKKAAKKEKQEKLSKADKDKTSVSEDEDTITITASSVDELIKKIEEQSQLNMSDNVLTAKEKFVGQKFDFSI